MTMTGFKTEPISRSVIIIAGVSKKLACLIAGEDAGCKIFKCSDYFRRRFLENDWIMDLLLKLLYMKESVALSYALFSLEAMKGFFYMVKYLYVKCYNYGSI